MAPIRRFRTAAFSVFVLCALPAALWMTFAVGTASAALLEGVTAPLQETVVAPVEEVTETVTPPVQAVTAPVQEVTETVTRPVGEAVETVPPAAKTAIEKVTPPVQAVAGTVASPPKTSGKAPGGSGVQVPSGTSQTPVEGVGTVVHSATGVATQAVQGAVGAVTDSTQPGQASADRSEASTPAVPATPGDSGRANSISTEPDLGPGVDTFEVPSNDGSVRAPFQRWLEYVWPAVALTGPKVANLLEHWEQHTLHLAALGTGTTGDAGSGSGPVVKGVHASGGEPQASKPSHSLFSRIPSALDRFPQSVPTSALAYLLIVAAMVLAVLIAIRWEIVHHRRQGQR